MRMAQKAARAAIEAAASDLDDGPRQLMRLAAALAAEARGLAAPWELEMHPAQRTEVAQALRVLTPADPAQWGPAELGALYEQIVSSAQRAQQGI